MLKYKRLKHENFEECRIIFEEIFSPSKIDFKSEWELMLKYGRIYGLYDYQKLIGFCSWISFGDEDYVTICNLTIDKSLHRKGYGTKMVKYVINQIKHKIKSFVAHTNEKLFFESLGFQVIVDFEDEETEPYKYCMNYILEN